MLAGILLIFTYTSIGLSLSSVSTGRFFPGIGLLATVLGTKTLASIVKNLFEREILYLISPYDCVEHVGQAIIGTQTTYDHSWTYSLVALVARTPSPCMSLHPVASMERLRMMPDMTQQGQPAAQTPSVPAVPVVLNGVSKSYGRIHASNITLGLSGATGILGMNGRENQRCSNSSWANLPECRRGQTLRHEPAENPAPYAKVGLSEHEKMHDWMTALEFSTLHGCTG